MQRAHTLWANTALVSTAVDSQPGSWIGSAELSNLLIGQFWAPVKLAGRFGLCLVWLSGSCGSGHGDPLPQGSGVAGGR